MGMTQQAKWVIVAEQAWFMLLDDPKMKVVQKALIVLFAAVFGFAAVTQSAFGVAPAGCKCCVADAASTPCPTSCCEAPVREEAPAAPASAPTHRSIDWQSLAVAVPQHIAPEGPPAYRFPAASIGFPPMRAVPIFQRDCSYLI
jgi:hypothetical protein